MSEERAKILEMVAAGKITAEEASRLLTALGDDEAVESSAADSGSGGEAALTLPPAEMPRFGNLWLIPMYVGLVLFVCGALAVYPPGEAGGSWLLVVCGWPVFVIGLLTMIGAWFARNSRWIHIRVTHADGSKRNIKLSFPLPLRLTAWALKIASRFVPKLSDTSVDEMIVALNEGLAGDQPLFIDVQEGENGERVQVYIG
jgi:hypothetical protein